MLNQASYIISEADMKNPYVIIVVLVITLFSSTLVTFSNNNNPIPDLNIPIILPDSKSILNNSASCTNDDEDFLLAVLGTDERENERSRSDVIILLKYKAKENKVIVVSVPRDSKILIPGKGMVKINSASAYGGSKLQVSVLEDLFKIKDVRYVHINFNGFKEIVNALGGIKIDAKKDFKAEGKDGDTFAAKGENILMGEELLAYVRYRRDAEGDFGRIKRQQEVLLSLASSILKPGNITKLPKVLSVISKNTDSDINIFFIMSRLKKLKNLESLKFEFYTLKTISDKSDGIWYEIIDEKDLELISDLLQN